MPHRNILIPCVNEFWSMIFHIIYIGVEALASGNVLNGDEKISLFKFFAGIL